MTTPNIVPRGNGEGGIGTNEKFWENGYFENLQTRGGTVATESYVQQKTEEHNTSASVHTANLASKDEAEAGINASKFMTPARVSDAIKNFAGADLTGMIFAFAGNTLPDGYLLCDGSQVSRTTYKKLFDVIGTTYGAGDGKTTFTLPNLIDRFLEGSSAAGSYRAAGLPNIAGYFECRGIDYQNLTIIWGDNNLFKQSKLAGNTSAEKANQVNSNSLYEPMWRVKFDAKACNDLYGNSTTVQPPAVTMCYIIKY